MTLFILHLNHQKCKPKCANDLEKQVVKNIHDKYHSFGNASVDPLPEKLEKQCKIKNALPIGNNWDVREDDQEELKKEVVLLKKEYKDELLVLKNYLTEKFVELFDAINSIKKRN